MPYYIGISNSAHDPAVAIIAPNGEILFAEALERFFQRKRAWDIPPDHWEFLDMIIERYCNPQEEFVIATSWSSLPFAGKDIRKEARLEHEKEIPWEGKYLPQRNVSTFLLPESDMYWLNYSQSKAFASSGDHLKNLLWHKYGNSKVVMRKYDHHLCHASIACHSSDFDEALCLIVDGEGEIGAVSAYNYKDGQLKRLNRSWGPGSLGGFYAKITELCGFKWRKGEEGKIMGLAAYGDLRDELTQLLDKMVHVDKCNLFFPKEKQITELLSALKNQFSDIFEQIPTKRADLACAGQLVFEKYMKALISNLHAKGKSDNLVLGGGCALNSSFNGKILEHTPFTSAHVPCAPGDDGNALGAAFLAYFEDNPDQRHLPSWKTPYLGSMICRDSLKRILSFVPSEHITQHPGTIHREVANKLAEGNIIGWVQGRAEFGPRALGNRSILADPRPSEMKDLINKKVKFRENFRPFAPSVMDEFANEWFEAPISSPYMSFTQKWRKASFEKVPAVVHKDGTGRLQTVSKQSNPKYHSLISEFHKITGIPIILNTSFNVMGKPIINSVEDAITVFHTTGLDFLCIDDYLIRKK